MQIHAVVADLGGKGRESCAPAGGWYSIEEEGGG